MVKSNIFLVPAVIAGIAVSSASCTGDWDIRRSGRELNRACESYCRDLLSGKESLYAFPEFMLHGGKLESCDFYIRDIPTSTCTLKPELDSCDGHVSFSLWIRKEFGGYYGIEQDMKALPPWLTRDGKFTLVQVPRASNSNASTGLQKPPKKFMNGNVGPTPGRPRGLVRRVQQR